MQRIKLEEVPVFEKYFQEGSVIWFVSIDSVQLFSLDLKNKILTYWTDIPVTSKKNRVYVGAIAKYKNKVVIAPGSGDSFFVYDIENNLLQIIECDIAENEPVKYVEAKIIKNKIFFVMKKFPGFAVFNCNNLSVQYFDNTMFCNQNELLTRGKIVEDGEYLYWGNIHNSKIIQLNKINLSSKIVDVFHENNGYDLLGEDKKIFAIPRDEGSLKVIDLHSMNFKIIKGYVGDISYIHQCFQRNLYSINKKSLKELLVKDNSVKQKKIDIFIKERKKKLYDLDNLCCMFYAEGLYLLTIDGMLWKFDKNNKIKKTSIYMDKYKYSEMHKNFFFELQEFNEDDFIKNLIEG